MFRKPNRFFRPINDQGFSVIALITAIMFLSLLGGLILPALTRSSHYSMIPTVVSSQSFAVAHGGLEWGIQRWVTGEDPVAANQALGQGTFTTATFNTNFDGSALAADSIRIRSTGSVTGAVSVSRALEQVLSRVNFGAFANDFLNIRNSGNIYSYRSSVTTSPIAANSTHNGNVGSNKQLELKNGSIIDGRAFISMYDPQDVGYLNDDAIDGDDDTYVRGSATDHGANLYYPGIQEIPWVNPDPLGIEAVPGGPLYQMFQNLASGTQANDNGSLASASYGSPAIPLNGKLILNSGDTLTLTGKSTGGGSIFYLDELTVKNGATLILDQTNGPVRIYLTKTMDFNGSSHIQYNGPSSMAGKPINFQIYANYTKGTSTADLNFAQDEAFKGIVYAPRSRVNMANGASIYGFIRGNILDVDNSGDFFFDEDLMSSFPGITLALKGKWREVGHTP